MSTILDEHLNEVKVLFLSFAKKVVANVQLATTLIIEKDTSKIDIVRENDKYIDNQEIIIEDVCIKIIAMYQPKANYLRFLVAILKVNNDLERISDLAVNMAKSVKRLAKVQEESLYLLPEMIEKVLVMLDMALKSLIDQDAKLALEVCKLDDDVDELKFRQRQIVSEVMEKKPEHIDYSLEVIVNGRRLERIADLCTNIAEDVIYITEGEIIRHRKWEPAN